MAGVAAATAEAVGMMGEGSEDEMSDSPLFVWAQTSTART